MTGKQRVDRALKGQDVDRTPFSYWHHFGLEKLPGQRVAEATLAFHRQFHTDLVKVMSDYPFPKPDGKWYELKVVSTPFPEQLRALELIRDSLHGQAYFVETIFNPWNVAEKLSSPEDVLRLKQENPQALKTALEAIAESEASHARKALAAGAAGVFLAIANAQDGIMTQQDYARFSEPFDRLILEAVSGAPLNILHLHGDKVYLDRFVKGWPAAAINYSNFGTGRTVAAMRAQYGGVLMSGLDEKNFRQLSEGDLRKQWEAAREAAGKKFILTPGCSVPNDCTDEELMRLVKVIGAGT
jgi:uroporphyrinogen decarboxylase